MKYDHLPMFRIDWVIFIFSFERDAFVFNSFKKNMIYSVLQPSVTLQLEYYFANKTPSFVSTSIIHPS